MLYSCFVQQQLKNQLLFPHLIIHPHHSIHSLLEQISCDLYKYLISQMVKTNHKKVLLGQQFINSLSVEQD